MSRPRGVRSEIRDRLNGRQDRKVTRRRAQRGRGTLAPRGAYQRMDTTSIIGSVAAFCTTVSYFPQLKKCWENGHAGDISKKMVVTLATGVALWAVYGALKHDPVIIVANTVSLLLLLGILYFKLRRRPRPASGPADG